MSKAAKFHVECRVGRLIEARLEWLNTATDVALIQDALNRAFTQAGASAIVCADCRAVEVLPPEVGEALIELLRRDNRRLERSAVLLASANAIFNLQLERIVREAANPARRAFRDERLLLAWLSEVLKPEELLRAKQMFAA